MSKTAIKSKREKAIERGMDHPVAVRKNNTGKVSFGQFESCCVIAIQTVQGKRKDGGIFR